MNAQGSTSIVKAMLHMLVPLCPTLLRLHTQPLPTASDIVVCFQFRKRSWLCRAAQAQQWQEAITKYSEGIAAGADAPPVFAAVLHSNRAAAYQGLQQYADAVADSLRAKALDPTYAKVGVIPQMH